MTHFRSGAKLESWLTSVLLVILVAVMLGVFLTLARGCA